MGDLGEPFSLRCKSRSWSQAGVTKGGMAGRGGGGLMGLWHALGRCAQEFGLWALGFVL